jgi:hypothetical protein
MTAPRANHLETSKQKHPLPKERRPDMTLHSIASPKFWHYDATAFSKPRGGLGLLLDQMAH